MTAETSEIIKDLKEYFADDENVQAIIKTLETATDSTKISTFFADRESVINPSSSGDSSTFSIAAAALVNVMANQSQIDIAPGKSLNATSGNLTVDSTLKNIGLSVGGHVIPKSLDTSATDVIVGVNNVLDLNNVNFAGVNTLTGNNISITANNKINHIYLNDGSGKGVNNSYRAAGTVAYAGGGAQANVDVGAVDNNFTGAWSGAGALNFRGADSGKTSVAMTGAVAVNNVNSTVVSDISANQNLTGAINNSAEKTGALIAAGLGLTVSKASSESSNYTGAASANVNLSDNVVRAVLKDNTAINSSAIRNVAKNLDTQITGGVNVSVAAGGKKGVAADDSVGYKNSDYGNKIISGALAVAGAGDGAAQASLAISDVDNDFKAEVTNSTLNIKNKTDRHV